MIFEREDSPGPPDYRPTDHLRSKIGTKYRVGPGPTTKWMTYPQVVSGVQQVRFYGIIAL